MMTLMMTRRNDTRDDSNKYLIITITNDIILIDLM